jgi:hypothetical protein
VGEVRLDTGEAAELGQLLDFLAQWLSRDDPRVAASYRDFVGHDSADVSELSERAARFAFLLGEDDDGQRLFGPGSD